ncbi:MAG: [FeFe] hydrogenase H-cluster radical SAM maturase HydG [Nitrospiraceae bacterium]|nr:MAG: [FeFe] hydrogenase H-cluster radical SAM maturase HydG [Nitrospiraceae bacterium]
MIQKNCDSPRVKDILAKSLDLQVLNLAEVSALLSLEDRDLWAEVFDAARRVKEKVYGKRIVLFAPLYLSNECTNDCLYCGFRSGNRDARRKTLTVHEAVEEANLLSNRGYKRLLLVASEHPQLAGISYIEQVVHAIYKETDIRILHANTAPMSVDDFRRLKECRIGVYQCFQETYHIPTYRSMHSKGTKADYAWRLNVMDRAVEAGFEDVGMGVLLGLYDWRWEAGALIAHSRRLMSKYGFGPHTLSVPRLQPAQGSEMKDVHYRVSDEDLKKIVAIYRLALPYVGVVVSTREPAGLRDELLVTGASQISAGSKTSPSGYMKDGDTEQFEIGDTRSLEEVINRIVSLGLVPSLCTACYREGRSGESFRHLAEQETMKAFCQENAILSLKEYMEDCASGEAKDMLKKLLNEEIEKSANGLTEKFKLIEKGKRDVHI